MHAAGNKTIENRFVGRGVSVAMFSNMALEPHNPEQDTEQPGRNDAAPGGLEPDSNAPLEQRIELLEERPVGR